MKIRFKQAFPRISSAALVLAASVSVNAQELVPIQKRATLGLPQVEITNSQFQSGPAKIGQPMDPNSGSSAPLSAGIATQLPQPTLPGQPSFRPQPEFQAQPVFHPTQPSFQAQPIQNGISRGQFSAQPTRPGFGLNWKKLISPVKLGGLGSALTGKSETTLPGHHPQNVSGHQPAIGMFVPPTNLQNNTGQQQPIHPQANQNIVYRQPLDPAGLLSTRLPVSPKDGKVETVLQRFPNGKVEIVRQVTQDEAGNYVNHGIWKRFQSNGQLLMAGIYDMGKRHGDWFQWHFPQRTPALKLVPYNQFNSPFLSKATFREDALHGQWLIYDARQQLASSISFNEGQRHGTAVWFYANARPMRQLSYNKGMIDGVYRQWNRDEKLQRQLTFKQGRPLLVETNYFDPKKKNKQVEQHFLGGTLVKQTEDDWQSLEIATYATEGDKVPHGPVRMWYANGQLRLQGQYDEGKQAGEFTWWHENGQKQLAGRYEDGEQVAQWTWWHPNGIKSIQGNYRDQHTEGLWTWWDPSGAVKRRQDFSIDTFQRPNSGQLGEHHNQRDERVDSSDEAGIPPLRASNASTVKD